LLILQVENVLIHEGVYKLADFGSCTTRVWHPQNASERSEAELDISKNTTMDYRAPEMCDLYRNHPITSQSDVWVIII
jgi:serine/threonine protein kinase